MFAYCWQQIIPDLIFHLVYRTFLLAKHLFAKRDTCWGCAAMPQERVAVKDCDNKTLVTDKASVTLVSAEEYKLGHF